MIRRFVAVIIGCAVLAAALALVCHFVFADVAPYVPGEEAQLGWRREVAFLITALAWLAAEFSGLLTIVLGAYLWNNRPAMVRPS